MFEFHNNNSLFVCTDLSCVTIVPICGPRVLAYSHSHLGHFPTDTCTSFISFNFWIDFKKREGGKDSEGYLGICGKEALLWLRSLVFMGMYKTYIMKSMTYIFASSIRRRVHKPDLSCDVTRNVHYIFPSLWQIFVNIYNLILVRKKSSQSWH